MSIKSGKNGDNGLEIVGRIIKGRVAISILNWILRNKHLSNIASIHIYKVIVKAWYTEQNMASKG